MGWDGMRDRFFRASRVMTGCGMRCDRDGMEKRLRDGPIYNPGYKVINAFHERFSRTV